MGRGGGGIRQYSGYLHTKQFVQNDARHYELVRSKNPMCAYCATTSLAFSAPSLMKYTPLGRAWVL